VKPKLPKLQQGVCRLVWSKLRETSREDISTEEAVRHLGDVICAWFRLEYPTKGERFQLVRILCRRLLNTPADDLSRDHFCSVIKDSFASEGFSTFNQEVGFAPLYAKGFSHTIDTWCRITQIETKVKDFKQLLVLKE
jgi:hypothetical protein